jgi:hypothetical protein
MPMDIYLERVVVRFPNKYTEFTNGFASLISTLGWNENQTVKLTGSSRNFHPEILVDFQSEHSDILTDFILSNGEIFSIKVENSTGQIKQNPFSYKPIRLETVIQRLATSDVRLIGIDHVGFNLPWFSPGVHPKILQLREKLSSRCLYHRYPTGEPWDFILPGDPDEIADRKAVDYNKVRRPKFELVSFENASTPLIQFDVGVNMDYERFSQLFPESLNDVEFRNIWVYLENPYTIDVCLVINMFGESDWSDHFKGFRL